MFFVKLCIIFFTHLPALLYLQDQNKFLVSCFLLTIRYFYYELKLYHIQCQSRSRCVLKLTSCVFNFSSQSDLSVKKNLTKSCSWLIINILFNLLFCFPEIYFSFREKCSLSRSHSELKGLLLHIFDKERVKWFHQL